MIKMLYVDEFKFWSLEYIDISVVVGRYGMLDRLLRLNKYD